MMQVPSVPVSQLPLQNQELAELLSYRHAYVIDATGPQWGCSPTAKTIIDAAGQCSSLCVAMHNSFFTQPIKHQFAARQESDEPGGYRQLAGKQLYEHKPGSTDQSSHPCHAAMEAVSDMMFDVAFRHALFDITYAAGCARPELLIGLIAGARQHSLLQISCYDLHPAQGSASPTAPSALDAHDDRGCVTVVFATGPGLQIESASGRWQEAQLGQGKLAIMPGCTLEYATGGAVTAARHQIRLPTDQAQNPRISLAFKLRFAPDAQLDPAAITGRAGASAAVTVQQLMARLESQRGSVNRVLPGTGQPAAGPGPSQPMAAHATSSLPQHAVAPGGSLTIMVRDQQGNHVHFTVKGSTKMCKVFNVYCQKKAIDALSIRFSFEGIRVQPDDTPSSLGMVDGDVVLGWLDQLD